VPDIAFFGLAVLELIVIVCVCLLLMSRR